MKYFLDSAKMDEIKYAYENYCIDGVTTNPKHIKLSERRFMEVVKEIAAWLRECGIEGKDVFPVSFEINPFLNTWQEMVEAAGEVTSYSPNIVTCGLGVYQESFSHPFTTYGLEVFRDAWSHTAQAE